MVSAVILSYNRCPEVLLTVSILKKLQPKLPFELEIIVVDNASVDDTSEKMREKHPDIILVTKTKNNGIAGWNEGFKVAKNKYFLVLDDDSHIHSGLIEAVEHMENKPEIGILALETVDEKLQMDVFLKKDDAWKDGEALSGFIGCGAIIRKELYDKIGGYAEWIYLYTHEFEYGIRCLDAGYQIKFFGKGIVVHRVSKINRLPKLMRIYATRNEMEIVNKYFTIGKTRYLIRILLNNLKFIKREGLKSGYYILSGAYQFLKIRNKIPKTPVSKSVQDFYAGQFWSTKPVFLFLKKRILKESRQLKNN
jgi:GT2 family glycosyltransferase